MADPIAELCAMLLCSGREDAILKLYPRKLEFDWNKSPTHARFTSNPDENIAGFWPGGLKRLEMLLYCRIRAMVRHLTGKLGNYKTRKLI
jgi:hypothetical protein